MNYKKWMTLGGFVLLIGLGAACGSATPTPAPAATPRGLGSPAPGLEILSANSAHVVGPNRFAFGVIRDGRSVREAQVHLKFYDLTSGVAAATDETDAPFFGDNLGEAGLYVAHTTFDKAGDWGVEATVNETGHAPETQRIAFEVLAQDPSPGSGDDAPRTKNPTLRDVNGDRTKISSALDDDSSLHQISIADAVTNGKPTVILFATPHFCTTRTCGPSHQVVMGLAQNYADKVNFIHVEVYKNFETFEIADALREWKLETEPWLFFVDKHGKIVEKFEGGITAKEIVPAFLKFSGL
ncbi:MAG: thioredoxin family protein [Chloroflexi bacterium]|nr:thioredoxin family protein [Chloroflexota bacterium]